MKKSTFRKLFYFLSKRLLCSDLEWDEPYFQTEFWMQARETMGFVMERELGKRNKSMLSYF